MMAIAADQRLREMAAVTQKDVLDMKDLVRKAAAEKLKSKGYSVSVHSSNGESAITARKGRDSIYVEITAHMPVIE